MRGHELPMTARRSATTARGARPAAERARPGHLPATHRPSGPARPAPSGRIENTAPAFLAAIDKGYGIECDLQAAGDGTPMVFHDERSIAWSRRRDGSPCTRAVEPRTSALQARRHPHSHVRRAFGSGRRPRAAAGRGEGQRARSARQASSTRSRARREPTRAQLRSCPSMATSWPSSAGWPRPCRADWWWAATSFPRAGGRRRARPTGAASSTRRLGSAPAGVAFFAVDVRMLRHARTWMSRARARAGALQLDHPHGPRAAGGGALGRRTDLRGLRGVEQGRRRCRNSFRRSAWSPCRGAAAPRSSSRARSSGAALPASMRRACSATCRCARRWRTSPSASCSAPRSRRSTRARSATSRRAPPSCTRSPAAASVSASASVTRRRTCAWA